MDKFNVRKGSLEVRSCDRYLTNSEEHDIAEIVSWVDNDEYCYVIAYFVPTSENFDLKFVGDRPFNVSWMDFMDIAKIGYRLLTEENKEEQ